MKLVDLKPVRTLRQPHEDMVTDLEKKLKKLGSGGYGTVFSLPGPVEKTLKIGNVAYGHRPKDDGFLTWMQRVVDKNNPFFPQVEKVRVYGEPGEEGVYNYKSKMERLTRGTQLSTTEVLHLWTRWLNQPITPLLHTFLMKEANELRLSYKGAALMWFARMIQAIVLNQGMDKFPAPKPPIHLPTITDKNMRNAIVALRRMISSGFDYDMHSNNIMFRRTPYGAQPVFVDPFE